jgi:hypothetical protein
MEGAAENHQCHPEFPDKHFLSFFDMLQYNGFEHPKEMFEIE